jgi:hypothetical protein
MGDPVMDDLEAKYASCDDVDLSDDTEETRPVVGGDGAALECK